MQWLAALCVKRPVFAWVLVLSLTVVGLFAFGQLGVDRFPNVDIPTISVTTRLPGAAPEQIETEVTDKIEESVNTISAHRHAELDLVRRHLAGRRLVQAREGRRHRGAGSARPRQPRHAAAAAHGAAADRGEARLHRGAGDHGGGDGGRSRCATSPSSPTASCAGASKAPTASARCVVIGGRKRQVNLWLDPALLRAQRLSVNDVARALQSQNADVPGGRMDQGGAVGDAAHARPHRDASTASATSSCARSTAIRSASATSRASKTAWPSRARRPASTATPTVLLQIRKQSGTNTVEVANNVKARLAELEPILPPGYSAAHRPRRGAVHRGVDRQRAGTPDRRLAPRGHRRVRCSSATSARR